MELVTVMMINRWEWNGHSEIFYVKISEHTVLHSDSFVKLLDHSLILGTQTFDRLLCNIWQRD